jgi:ABC-type antimicrobial peptide transport system, ATPase component
VHSDINAHYQLTCATPEKLAQIDLTPLYKAFPATQKINVQLIGPNGQKGVETSPPRPWSRSEMRQALIELQDLLFAWPGQAPLLDIPALPWKPVKPCSSRGPSGSGKTTLLGLLGGVNRPGQGRIQLLGQDLALLGQGARDRFRVDHTGYIFQQFNLLPFLSVRENVELPCRFSRSRAERAIQRHGSVDQAASELLAHLGLGDPALLHGVPTACRSASSSACRCTRADRPA